MLKITILINKDYDIDFYKISRYIAKTVVLLSPTSVPSERLFSAAGNLHDDKRNRIMSELSEELLFIQNNFLLVGTMYK